ncbi:hypothetical protein [Streptomyces asiaticus]|uniref:hypothetical protein n=1 Tax=Streptomyces asiaticus TaxID=114695 RepID=UPI00382F42D3
MSREMTVDERGDLAEEMLPVAANLAVLVHGDGGPEEVRDVLDGLNDAQRNALIVVLAGMVDPDRPMGTVLGWLDFNEHGQQIVPDWNDKATLRDVADRAAEDADDWDGVDHVKVERWLKGFPAKLTREERVEAILEGFRRGMQYRDLDHLSGVKSGTTLQFISRERRAAHARGEDFPDDVLPSTSNRMSEAAVIEMRERAAAGATDMEIALAFNVTPSTAGRIVTGGLYSKYGGPIRAKKDGQPREESRVMWLHSKGKLSPGQRDEIRQRSESERVKDLASDYGVSISTIYQNVS